MENNAAILELEKAKADLLQKVAQIDTTINTLISMAGFYNGNGVAVPSVDYNKKDTLKKKVAFVIKRENRFLHVREIAKFLHELERNVSVDDFMQKLTGAITSLKRDEVIIKLKVGLSNQNTFWGSKNWIENGKPKNGYEPNESYLQKSEEIII